MTFGELNPGDDFNYEKYIGPQLHYRKIHPWKPVAYSNCGDALAGLFNEMNAMYYTTNGVILCKFQDGHLVEKC